MNSHLAPYSDAMYQYFKYGTEFVEIHLKDKNKEIEDFEAKLNKENQKLGLLKIEVKQKEDIIPEKEKEISYLEEKVKKFERNLRDAQNMLAEHQKKYEKDKKKGRNDSEKAMKVTAFIPVVNLIAVPVAALCYLQYEEDMEKHSDNVRAAQNNLDRQRNDLNRKKRDLEACKDECRKTKRELKDLERKINQTNEYLRKKKAERDEKITTQVLMRRVCQSASLMTRKTRVLRNETRGGYSIEPIDPILQELISHITDLSKMQDSPIQDLDLRALEYNIQQPEPNEELLVSNLT